jgi:hypothetical protein
MTTIFEAIPRGAATANVIRTILKEIFESTAPILKPLFSPARWPRAFQAALTLSGPRS